MSMSLYSAPLACTYIQQGLDVKVWNSYEAFVAELTSRFPHEAAGIRSFYGDAWKCSSPPLVLPRCNAHMLLGAAPWVLSSELPWVHHFEDAVHVGGGGVPDSEQRLLGHLKRRAR
eukprot:230278-Chlamydomonas_euryale.AAC.3